MIATSSARNAPSSSRNDSPTTPPMNSGSRFAVCLALVDRRRGHPADVDVAQPARGRRAVAQVVHEVLRCGVLRRRRGRHREHRSVAGGVALHGRHGRDTGLVADVRRHAVHRGAVGRAVGLGDDEQRAVRARAEPAGDHVVRLAGRRAGAVVARVGEPEPQARDGQGEREQRRGRQHGGEDGAALHAAGPPGRGRRAGVGRRTAGPRDAQPVDTPAHEAEQRGQQRHGRGHDDHDGEHRRERSAVQVRQAHEEQPEQRDDDRRAGDEHRAPGSGDRLHRRVTRFATRRHRRSMTGEDEQRVVDADAEAHHHAELGAQSGTSVTAARTPNSEPEIARPNSAVISGRPRPRRSRT